MNELESRMGDLLANGDWVLADVGRAGAIIDRMRTMLRRGEIEMIPLEVGQILRDTTTLLRPDAAARRVRLELDIPDGLPPVLGDRVQLQQVLLNLILNALDALEGVGGQDRTVSMAARCETDQVVEISVADNGRGIAPDQIDRIFEPFFSTKSRGLGMGLSISRTVIEAHGGRLWAENSADGGATLRMTLPLAAAAD